MSLINDALKKAQKQRAGEAPSLGSMPSIGGERPTQIASRRKSSGAPPLLLWGGLGAGLIALGVAGLFVFGGKSKTPAPAVATAPASPPVVQPPATPSPAPAPQPTSAFTIPNATPAPPPSPTPAAPAVTVAKEAPAPTSAPTVTATPQAPVVAPARPLEPHAIEFIDKLKVAGIMARGSDSKVLMNDRVYRAGSLVDATLGLRLVEIAPAALTFEDANGGRYTRTF